MAPRRTVLFTLLIVFLPIVAVVVTYRVAVGWDRDTEPAVRALLESQQAAWNSGDMEGFLAGYWDSDELTFFSDDHVERGLGELRQRYRKKYQEGGKEMGRLTFSDLDVTTAGRSHAVARGRWKVERSGETLEGLFTLALYKFSAGWKITHDHTSAKKDKP